MNDIKKIKLNKNYESDPNIANPKIRFNEEILVLTFELNYFKFPFSEGQLGEINFTNCYSYRIGEPNDEGFYFKNNSFWNKKEFPDIEWNCFYKIEGAPLEYFEKFTKVIKTIPKNDLTKKLNHFVFFMKEGTFECLAGSYLENI